MNPVLAQLEKDKERKQIKSSREARVLVRLKTSDWEKFFKPYEKQLSTVMGCQTTSFLETAPEAELKIEFSKAEGNKCARCWIYKMDLGAIAAFPDVCRRCAEAVEEWQKGLVSDITP